MKHRRVGAYAALLCAYSALVYVPLDTYSANSEEFSVGLLEVLSQLALPLGAAVALLLGLVAIAPSRSLKYVIALLCSLSALIYIQSTLLVWDYGVFNGQAIDWGAFRVRSIVELLIWLGTFTLALCFATKLAAVAKALLTCLTLIYLLNTAHVLTSRQFFWQAPSETLPVKPLFEFSKQSNVILILLDGFPSPAFEQLIAGNVEFRESFREFKYYRNASGSFPTTYPSIPAILSGAEYDNSIEMHSFLDQELKKASFPGAFLDAGYRSDLVTIGPVCRSLRSSSCRDLKSLIASDRNQLIRSELALLMDISLFKQSPHLLKKRIHNNENWLLQRLFRSKSSQSGPAQTRQFVSMFEELASNHAPAPTLKFFHLALPHLPLRFDAQCNKLAREKQRRETTATYLGQAACALRLTDKLLARLKELDVFEQSFVVILADHGHSIRLPSTTRKPGFPDPSFAAPLLLLKPPTNSESAAKELQVMQAPARLADLSRTLSNFYQLGVSLPGEDILDLAEDQSRERIYRHYKWEREGWTANYLPIMQEYVIQGSPWDTNNWRPSRVLGANAGSHSIASSSALRPAASRREVSRSITRVKHNEE